MKIAASPARLTGEIVLVLAVGAIAVTVAVAAHRSPALVGALALTVLVLIPLRLVRPAAALLAAAVIGAVLNEVSAPLMLVLAVSAGYRATTLPRATAVFGGVLAIEVAEWAVWNRSGGGPVLLLQLAGFLFIVLVPALIAQMIGQRRQLIVAMHDRNAHLREQQAVVAEQAQARERDRIARELHDSLGNRLTLMSMYTGALRNRPDLPPAETVDLLWRTSTIAMAELRQVLGVLRQSDPGAGDDAGRSLTELDELIASTRSAGAAITLAREGTPVPLPSLIDHAAYRTVQEGVTNSLRHARGAPIQVTLRYEPDAVVVEVVNGPGTPHPGPTSGQGLIGLAERIRLAGGLLYHGPDDDQGFRLAATLPPETREPEPRRVPAGTPPTDEVSQRLRRRAGRSRIGLALGAVAAVVLVCGFAAGGLVLYVRGELVTRQTYETVTVGETEASVRAKIPPQPTAPDLRGAPPVPAGQTCVDDYAESSGLLKGKGLVYRFCFRDGTLVAKEAFTDAGT